MRRERWDPCSERERMVVHAMKGMEDANGRPYLLLAVVRPTSAGFNPDDLAAFRAPLSGESILLRLDVIKPAEPRALSRECDAFVGRLYRDFREMLLTHPCPEHGDSMAQNMRIIFTRFEDQRLLEIFCCCGTTKDWIVSSMSWIRVLNEHLGCSLVAKNDRAKHYFYGKAP